MNVSTEFYTDLTDILIELDFKKKGKKELIANIPAVFDIETSSFYEGCEKRACMYAWVFGIGGRCVRGRTWEDFVRTCIAVSDYYKLSANKRLIVYIHNLAYEFQWFRHLFEWERVFSIDQRTPIYAISNIGIEFRCSYLLSGYGLSKVGENLTKYKVKKSVGDLDYNLIRHSSTPLTDKEWGYILNDGLVVMAFIQEEIERLGDITKIPITKTGYVRQLCKDMCLTGKGKYNYSNRIRNLKLTVDDYNQLKRVFAGGFTHANINYVNKEIRDVYSFDFSSSYPAVMLSELYPMSSPEIVTINSEEELLKNLDNYCCMFDCVFYNIRSTCSFENYISKSRCTICEHYIQNNGRIVEASMLRISLTEQDYFIIDEMYEWDGVEFLNFKRFRKGYLPMELILTILELYQKKTSLKGVDGKEAEYLHSKEMINSMYGMCVTDPCRDEITYDNGLWGSRKGDIDSLITRYNTNPNRFLYYPWGVWVTAYARANLFTGILEFKDDYIYSDTDSIKVLNLDRHKEYIEKYNKSVTKKIKKCLDSYGIPMILSSPKTIKGMEKPMGVWDFEGKYDKFKTLGAKRYMVETDGETEITVAGVSKKAGMKYLKHTYKTNSKIFKAFKYGLHFPSNYECNGEECNGSGKMLHTYIDIPQSGKVIDYLGNEGYYNEMSSIHLENTDYTLGLDYEFVKLLNGIRGEHLLL